MGKTGYFASKLIRDWPKPDEVEDCFLAPPGERWANSMAGILGEYSYVVERDRDGTCRVWRRPPTTVAWVEASLARIGMRLPTCDEWEYACGAAAPTLFRWGDDNPADSPQSWSTTAPHHTAPTAQPTLTYRHHIDMS